MKPSIAARLFVSLITLAWAGLCCSLFAQGSSSPSSTSVVAPSESVEAWNAIANATAHPVPPLEWREKQPSPDAIEAWRKSETERLAKLAGQARDFYGKFPKDVHAPDARRKERQALASAARFGDPAAQVRLEEVEQAMLKDPATSAKDRYDIRSFQVRRKASDNAELERGARELLKEFPGEPQSYALLLASAAQETSERSRGIAEEVLKSNAPEEIKAQAKGLLKKMDSVGKPLDLRFSAVDGRTVDLQQMKGKVVLVDFWATWCGPCVAEIPHVKEAYAKLHDKGFEIVGVSFDSDKAKLEAFIQEKEMSWPQYFDGKGWGNQFAQEFAINSIPAMWLVDKRGVLRDLSARGDLMGKVEKLLEEP